MWPGKCADGHRQCFFHGGLFLRPIPSVNRTTLSLAIILTASATFADDLATQAIVKQIDRAQQAIASDLAVRRSLLISINSHVRTALAGLDSNAPAQTQVDPSLDPSASMQNPEQDTRSPIDRAQQELSQAENDYENLSAIRDRVLSIANQIPRIVPEGRAAEHARQNARSLDSQLNRDLSQARDLIERAQHKIEHAQVMAEVIAARNAAQRAANRRR